MSCIHSSIEVRKDEITALGEKVDDGVYFTAAIEVLVLGGAVQGYVVNP